MAPPRSKTTREIISVLFIAALAAVMLFPALRGDWPIGGDHPIHLFRTWQLKESLLEHGTPWTWSHRWFAGYPQNVVYPVGADFFVLAMQGLSLGQLSLGQAYGVSFWLFYVMSGYAAFLFVRLATGSRLIGLIAGFFFVTDAGSNDIGGWFWLVDLGVWTAALGMVPSLIATLRIAALLESPAPRTAAAIGACVGLALLCHPLHLIYFAIAVPLLCASRYLTEEKTSWRRALPLLGAACLCGALIASFWLVPHLAASSYIREMGSAGSRHLAEIGAKIARVDLFPRMHPLPAALGLIGSLVLLKARRVLPLFMGLFTFTCIALSTPFYFRLFGQEVESALRNNLIFTRFLMLAKPFWYGAAAFLLVASWKVLPQMPAAPAHRLAETNPNNRLIVRLVKSVLICAIVGPILFYASKAFFQKEALRTTRWHSQRQDLAARAAFVAWTRTEIPPEPGFFRIAHGFGATGHDLSDLAIEVPFPFFKVSDTPTGHFEYSFQSSANEALRAANVRFVLSGSAINRPGLQLIRVFDQRLWLYAFKNWNPNPFEISEGSGEVKLTKFSNEEIDLQAEPGAHGLLRLNVSFFPKWQASRDGVTLPIASVALPGVKRSAFMQVPLLPGTYRFQYRRDASDYAGTIMCLIGVAGCLALANWERLRRLTVGGSSSSPSTNNR